MITEDFNNKLNALFPNLTNADTNGNTLSSADLWKGVSEKYADGVKKILAPVASQILDVQTDLQLRNPDACPVVQVEVISSMGDALIDGQSWDVSAIKNKYVDVKLHRVSRPFKLTAYDIMRGERIESKVKAAMESVAQGVNKIFYEAFGEVESINLLLKSGERLTPEKAVSIPGHLNADSLALNPYHYSGLVPTNGLGLDPKTEGVYGIGHIYKDETIDNAVVGFAWEKDGIVGAVATPEILFNKVGQGMQFLGEIGGIPMVLISNFDYNTQTVKCSVETLAGFAVTDAKKVMTFVSE